MLPELRDKEMLPIEFLAKKHDCCATGFIAKEYAESINYEYRQLAAFVAGILDDNECKHEDGLYEFQGIIIKLIR